MNRTTPWMPACLIACASSAGLAEEGNEALLDTLVENGAITQEQRAELSREREGNQRSRFTTSIDEDGLHVTSAGEDFEVNVGGRLHADWARHFSDEPPLAPVNGTNLRRARVELGGTFDRDWRWAAEVDFAGGEAEIKDFSLGFAGFDDLRLTAGNQKQPYSHSLEMSSNDIPFISRSIDHALIVPFVDRATGVRIDAWSERWFAAAGVFGKSRDDSSLPGDEGWGVSGRFVFAPLLADRRVLHLGIRAAYREPETADRIFRLAADTTDFSDLSIVDTGALTDVESVTLYGPEFAAAFGPLWLTGEFNFADLDGAAPGGADPGGAGRDLDYESWHVGAAWMLGGESRAATYDIEAGEFKRLEPQRGFRLGDGGGTWELAARYASIDLTSPGTVGGREETLTLGGNWYANANIRFMLDWTRVIDTDDSNDVRRAAEGLNVLALRAQFAF